MNPLGMLKSLSVTGGAANSSASGAPSVYAALNSPFNVAGAGAKLSSAGSAGLDTMTIIFVALIAGAVFLAR